MLAVFFLLIFTPFISVGLISVDGETAAVVVNAEAEVIVIYRHSVEHYLVVERYVVESCSLRLAQLEWAGFGAGMPSSLVDISNEAIQWKPGEGAIAKINLTLGHRIAVSVRYAVDYAIFLNNVSIDVENNVTIETCLKISIVDLLIEYSKLVLLRLYSLRAR